ncbi:hypothetical protein [Tateyamaria sp. SN3-11]|uniref:hypothetical protein n=1 Tax=Tateyamaria sp. SN3-11 TaxID=3092147 RepID=UPI0039E94638
MSKASTVGCARYLLAIVLMCLALPAMAQQQSVCRGKQSFKLSDGSSGCLLGAGESTIKRSVLRDGQISKTNTRGAATIGVAMFGQFNPKWRVSTPRMKEVCTLFSDAAIKSVPNGNPKSIVVQMIWPDVPNPSKHKHLLRKSRFANQTAYMSKSCRSVNYFR